MGQRLVLKNDLEAGGASYRVELPCTRKLFGWHIRQKPAEASQVTDLKCSFPGQCSLSAGIAPLYISY